MLRTSIKRVLEAIQQGEGTSASAVYVSACSVLDKAVKSGLIHKNKAARHKSHLSQKLKAIGAPTPVKLSEARLVKVEPKKAEKKVTKKSEKVTDAVVGDSPAKKKAEAKPKVAKKATAEKKAESKPKAKK